VWPIDLLSLEHVRIRGVRAPQTTFGFQCPARGQPKVRKNRPRHHRPGLGETVISPSKGAVHRVACPFPHQPVVSPLWDHRRSMTLQNASFRFGSILRVRSSLPERSVPAQCSCNALHRFLAHRSLSSRRSNRSVHPRTSAPLLRPGFITRSLPALPGLNPNRANLHLECSWRQARTGCAGISALRSRGRRGPCAKQDRPGGADAPRRDGIGGRHSCAASTQ
jgi:hypothetical protein